MKNLKKIGLIGIGLTVGGIATTQIVNQEKKEVVANNHNATPLNTDNTKEAKNSPSYTYDNSLERKAHSNYKESIRPIIECFVEIYKGISPQETDDILSRAGNTVKTDITFDAPSEYEKFEIQVINDLDEKVIITFKEGMVISKEYIKDYKNPKNDKAYIQYKSELFKTDYISELIVNSSNISTNDKDIWEFEEEVLSKFN